MLQKLWNNNIKNKKTMKMKQNVEKLWKTSEKTKKTMKMKKKTIFFDKNIQNT